MSTFLELCQDVAEESGTIPTIGDPQTAQGQTGRLLRIVNWVRKAHNDVQRMHRTWRWLEADFSGNVIATQQAYTPAELGITRFGHWIWHDETGANTFTFYLDADGQSEEGALYYVEWPVFRRDYMVGSNATQTGKPAYVTVNPANQLVLWPIPNAAGKLRGRYRKGHQTLSADSDTPEMPADFHDVIKWKALMYMATFDEAMEQLPMFDLQYNQALDRLEKDQLPRVRLAGPLA